MDNLIFYVVFYCGGVVLVNVFSAVKFMILAVAVTFCYLVYSIVTAGGVGAAVISSIVAFACIQLGYVSGIGLRAAYASMVGVPSVPARFQSRGEGEETELK